MTYEGPIDEEFDDISDDPSPAEASEVDLTDSDDVDDADDATPRKRPRGTYLGAAMLGLQEAMFGKVKEDTVIEIEASGEPPNIDLDGLDAPFGADGRLVGPPLDQIKSRATRRRRKR